MQPSADSDRGDNPPVSPPFVEIANFLATKGWTQETLARELDVSRQTVNMLVSGKRAISFDMSCRLGKVTGKAPDYWIRQQFEFDLVQSTKEGSSDDGTVATFPIRRFGIAAMTRPSSGILVDHEMKALFADNDIINPFNPKNVQPATYDVTMGRRARSAGETEWVEIDENGVFVLHPACTLLIETTEIIKMPRDMTARVGSPTWLFKMDVFSSTGIQIDPTFKGPLFIALHNHGACNFELRPGDVVASLEFHRLNQEPEGTWSGAGDGTKRQSKSADMVITKDELPGFMLPAGNIMVEVTEVNETWCARVSGHHDMEGTGATQEEAKNTLIAYLRDTYSFCEQSKYDDDKSLLQRLRQFLYKVEIISAEKVEALVARIGADVKIVGSSTYATIMEGPHRLGRIVLPNGAGITMETLSSGLGLNLADTLRILDGRMSAEEYRARRKPALPVP